MGYVRRCTYEITAQVGLEEGNRVAFAKGVRHSKQRRETNSRRGGVQEEGTREVPDLKLQSRRLGSQNK